MDIRIPEVGESVQEALLAKWFKKHGDPVKKDEPLCEIETDKITLDVNADAAGTLSIQVAEGTTVKIGTVVGAIDETAVSEQAAPVKVVAGAESASREENIKATVSSPSIRREMREQQVVPESVTGTGRGGRITLDDLFSRITDTGRRKVSDSNDHGDTAIAPMVSPAPSVTAQVASPASSFITTAVEPVAASVKSEVPPVYDVRRDERKAMSPLRKRISERLVSVRQQTAMLTTFNEIDMSRVAALRDKYREHFKLLHGTPLGLMPFFVKGCIEALREFPAVNASIDGDAFVYHSYYDIGVAIGGEKGLVVPVIRDADQLKSFEIDKAIVDFKNKITTNRIAISDLTGGTFTISNGGIYGSMLSTPILNPPQSAVLGMHAIQDRPVVRDGQIVIRPMMYLALSYDHRIIDGREAVGFLKRVKTYIEDADDRIVEG